MAKEDKPKVEVKLNRLFIRANIILKPLPLVPLLEVPRANRNDKKIPKLSIHPHIRSAYVKDYQTFCRKTGQAMLPKVKEAEDGETICNGTIYIALGITT